MNIVSNTCLGAFITRDVLRQQYCNPFSWNIIDYDSMLNLINHYNKLSKLSIRAYRNEADTYATIQLGSDIKIAYVHIKEKKFESIVNSPERSVNVFVTNCAQYAMKQFTSRIKRMRTPPVFLLHVQSNHEITGNLQKLLHLLNNVNTPYPIIVVTKEKLHITNKKAHIRIINESDECALNRPKVMAEKIGNILKQIFQKKSA